MTFMVLLTVLKKSLKSHVFAVHEDKINVCRSVYVTLNNNCTLFDGNKFNTISSTHAAHTRSFFVSTGVQKVST